MTCFSFIKKITGIAIIIFLLPDAVAQDAEGFSGNAGLGFLSTTGNSDNQSLNAKLDLWWNYEPWNHSLGGSVIRSETTGTTTAEATSISWQSKYNLNDTDYLFGLLIWDTDKFSAYEDQLRETLGYGKRFLDGAIHYLDGEVGVGARQTNLIDGTSRDETIGYLGANYRWTISDSAAFTQNLRIESGSDNTYVEAASSLTTRVRESLALVLGFTVKNNSDVLPDTKSTDTFTTVSLEYAF